LSSQFPAVLICYGDFGQRAGERVRALAAPDALLAVCDRGAFDLEERVAAIASDVPGNTVVRVIHLVGEDMNRREVIAERVRAVDSVVDRFPALATTHWVIDCVGQDLSDDELELPASVMRRELHGIGGLLLISRSSEAQALLDVGDEVQMGADLAHILLTTDMSSRLGELCVAGAGVTSVIYRRRVVIAAIAAFHAAGVIADSLLAPPGANSPYRGLGHTWAAELAIAGDEHRELLLVDPVGGSARSYVRFDPGQFAKVHFEVLPDSLSSYADELLTGRAREAYAQIRRNADQHAATIGGVMDREAVTVVRESMNLDRSDQFWAGVDDKFAEIELALRTRLADLREDIPDPDEARQEIERKVRHLPYRWALVARALGALAVGATVGQVINVLAHGHQWWVPLIALATVLLGVGPFVARYALAVRRIRKLVRIFVHRLQQRLNRNIEINVTEAILREITLLRGHLGDGEGAIKHRLAGLRRQLGELRDVFQARVTHRVLPSLEPTRLSMLVPADEYPTGDLAARFPLPADLDVSRVIVEAIVIDSLELVFPDAERRVLDVLEPHLPNVWRDLPLTPDELPSTFQLVRNLLATPTAPIVRRGELAAAEYEFRRLLCVPGPWRERMTTALEEPPLSDGFSPSDSGQVARVDIDGKFECADRGFVGLVSLASLGETLSSIARGSSE